MNNLSNAYSELDFVEIEREARAMQARVLGELFSALGRSIVRVFTRAGAPRAA